MIFLKLQDPDGNRFIVNASCIEMIEEMSDNGPTSIRLTSGRFVMVSDSIDEMIDEINWLVEEAAKKIGGKS